MWEICSVDWLLSFFYVPVPHGSDLWRCSLARCCTITCLWNNPATYLWTMAGLWHDQRASFVIVSKFVFCACLIFVACSLIARRGLSRHRHRSVVARDESERCDNKCVRQAHLASLKGHPLCFILMRFPPTLWSKMDSLSSEVFHCFSSSLMSRLSISAQWLRMRSAL